MAGSLFLSLFPGKKNKNKTPIPCQLMRQEVELAGLLVKMTKKKLMIKKRKRKTTQTRLYSAGNVGNFHTNA